MSILISGSLAYDYIMDFPDSFRNHILPEQIHILNVCFVVDNLQKNFGGTAGNIAYNMKMLGGEPIIFSPIGSDGMEYLSYLEKLNLNTKYIKKIADKLCGSAHITTDKDDNQITAFYNGAHDKAVEMKVSEVEEKLDLVLISPTSKNAMIAHAKECYEKNIPICFDPGQQITAFSAQELQLLVGQAKIIIGNDYEIKLLQEKTGWNMAELLKHAEVVITTLGDRGSVITTKEEIIEVSVCSAHSVDDPTGAGDAYRAGFFLAYIQGKDLKACAQVGATTAVYAVENYGTQNHVFTKVEFENRYEENFGEKIVM